jgi:regulator of CtrA degradation
MDHDPAPADPAPALFRAQVESLYVEAMVMADEAYSAFSAGRDPDTGALSPVDRVAMACESLKTTTRLMHVIAWLLHQRALLAGEPGASAKDRAAELGEAIAADDAVCARFAPAVQRIVGESERLFARVKRLDGEWRAKRRATPVQALLGELQARLHVAAP